MQDIPLQAFQWLLRVLLQILESTMINGLCEFMETCHMLSSSLQCEIASLLGHRDTTTNRPPHSTRLLPWCIPCGPPPGGRLRLEKKAYNNPGYTYHLASLYLFSIVLWILSG